MSNALGTKIEISKYAGNVGAVISGVDLARDDDEQTAARIRCALVDYGVIFIPEQHGLTMEQYIAFGRRMGELAIGDGAHHPPGLPELQMLVKEADRETGIGDLWHSDQTFRDRPCHATILRSVEVPPFGGDTIFVSVAAAFEALPEAMKDTLRSMKAVHSRSYARERSANSQMNASLFKRSMDSEETAVHPVVLRHSQTGREALFVNPGYTIRFDGWTVEQSAGLMKHLFDHCLKPEFQCRYRWSANTVACWDNTQTWHYAVNDYHGHRREMHRLIVQ